MAPIPFPQRMKHQGIRWLCLAAGVLAVQMSSAFAQSGAANSPPNAASAGVGARYPAGSIKSVEAADAALAGIARERSDIETRFAAEEQACHPKFFATSCIDEAKERRRRSLTELRKVELEANAFKRREQAREQDRSAAERTGKVQADRQERAREPEGGTGEEGRPKEPAPGAVRNVEAPAVPDRRAQHEAKLKQQQEEDRQDAARRAENVAKYEEKVRAAQERQKRVKQRKAEKEEKRRARQAAQ